MEKIILLSMQPNKNIDIMINGHRELTIERTSRTIKADVLYNVLRYSRGDTYSVEKVNETGLDIPVLDFFAELFSDICRRLNSISNGEEEQITEQEELNITDSETVTIPDNYQVDTDELPF